MPSALLPLAALGLLFLMLPVAGLVVRAPWSTLPDLLTRPESLDALRLSLLCATLATLVCLVLGVPLAWLLARARFRGRAVVRALVMVPLVLPPVVGGVALFTAFGRRGIVGRPLDDWVGVSLPFTTPAVVLAEAFVAMPFLVIAVEGLEFPEAAEGVNDYPVAVLRDAPNRTAARAFVALVRSGEGLAVLSRAGFERP
ncbi:MAG TPA: substrate-binding domain-containing protein [Anaeromyxobacter sp.]|nr:substrate-binding domain-containing protein [Anaeromyxobacter sp.]